MQNNQQPFLLSDSHYVLMFSPFAAFLKPSICSSEAFVQVEHDAFPTQESFSLLSWSPLNLLVGTHPPLGHLATFRSSEHSPLCAKPKLVKVICKTFDELRAKICHPNCGVLCLRTEVTPLKALGSMHT